MRFLVLLFALLLPAAVSAQPCGTPHLLDVLTDPALSAEERHAVQWRWSAPYRAMSTGARDACVAASAVSLDGTPYDSSEASEHFVVHWDAQTLVGDDAVPALLDVLESTLDRLTSELGYRAPDHIDEYQMVVTVEDLAPLGVAGFAWLAPCDGDLMGFFTLDRGVVTNSVDEDFRAEVVAHEMFHTVQFSYGLDEFYAGWADTPNKWWIEASATYLQGVVAPAGDDYLQFFSTLWASVPWKSMETHDEMGHQYGMFVFPLSVEANLGDATWHRELWERLDLRAGYRMPEEFDAVLQAHSSSFLEEYGDFLARGAEGDFPRYDFLLGIRDLTLFASIPNATTADYTAIELPIEGEMSAGSVEAPEYLGANFVWFGTTQAEESKALVMHFYGDVEVDGEPTEWTVEFAAVRAGEVLQRYTAEPELVDDEWQAHVRLDGVVEHYEGAYMIASPVVDFGEGAPGWRWAAELRKGGTDGTFSEATAGRGCTEGCRGANGTWVSAFPLLFLLTPIGIARRTRRS